MDRFFRAFSVSGAKFVGYTDDVTGTYAPFIIPVNKVTRSVVEPTAPSAR